MSFKQTARRMIDLASFSWGKAKTRSGIVRRLRNPLPHTAVGLLRAGGASIGERTTIKGRLYLDNAELSNLRIGENCYIGDGVYMDLAGPITIGDGAVLSAGVMLVTHQDANRSPVAERYPRRCEPVTIGAGAWLGVRATVLVGVTMGERSILAAHSLLMGDTDADTLYVGAPAHPR